MKDPEIYINNKQVTVIFPKEFFLQKDYDDAVIRLFMFLKEAVKKEK
jgi:hypothetical protein